MSKRHENEQFIVMFHVQWKKIDFDEQIVQIEKVFNLTGKSEHVLTLAKPSGTPYKMISWTPSNTVWSELKMRQQEVYSLVATNIHAATDLLRKQHPNESLQDYIAYWNEMCHSSMKCDPVNINNKLVIVLFIKNLYNKDIRCRIAGAKNVNTLLDAFKMAQWNLLKLRKYEGLVSEGNSIHSVHTVNQISDISKSRGHFSQTENINQTLLPGQDRQPNSSSPGYPNNQYQNSYQCAAPYFGICYVCGILGHLGKNCPNRTNNLQSAQFLSMKPTTINRSSTT